VAGDPSRSIPAVHHRPAPTPGLHALARLRESCVVAPLGCRFGAVARLRTTTATSAGGIVVRRDDGTPHLVVGSRRRERDGRTWTLPKGTPNPGETREETAIREVAEETGLEVRITRPLDSIEYSFVQGGARIHKTVHYFLMEPIGGELSRHDHEFDEVRWVSFDEAPGLLTFATERALVARAAALIETSDTPGTM
jgi:8-oxo-dGTP pyrophosphatase MutT (NUDIX family)